MKKAVEKYRILPVGNFSFKKNIFIGSSESNNVWDSDVTLTVVSFGAGDGCCFTVLILVVY